MKKHLTRLLCLILCLAALTACGTKNTATLPADASWGEKWDALLVEQSVPIDDIYLVAHTKWVQDSTSSRAEVYREGEEPPRNFTRRQIRKIVSLLTSPAPNFRTATEQDTDDTKFYDSDALVLLLYTVDDAFLWLNIAPDGSLRLLTEDGTYVYADSHINYDALSAFVSNK